MKTIENIKIHTFYGFHQTLSGESKEINIDSIEGLHIDELERLIEEDYNIRGNQDLDSLDTNQ